MNGIIQRVTFGDWLFSLSIISRRFHPGGRESGVLLGALAGGTRVGDAMVGLRAGGV